MAKTYIEGTSCKEVSGEFGSFHNISINLDKIKQYANEKGYVNMTMSKRRETGQYGDTHYFTLNEWSPESKTTGSSVNNGEEEFSIENVPF